MAKGIYSGSAAGQDDYAIRRHGLSGKYFVDRIARGGTHVTIGGVKGVSTLAEAKDLCRTDAHGRRKGTGAIFEQQGEELLETDQVAPYFKLGDQVARKDDPSFIGKIGYVGSYQGSEYGGYQYKVDWDNGAPRHYVPESKLRLLRGGESFSQNGRGIYSGTPAREGNYVIFSKGGTYHPSGRSFYVDRVEEGGKHTGLSKAVGDPSMKAALRTVQQDMREWETRPGTVAIWKQTPEGLEQIHMDYEENDPVTSFSPNGRREEPDTQAARELSLYVENEYSLVGAPNSQGKAIEKNLLKKIQGGTFDLARSEDAWMYLIEAGAKKYAKEFDSPGNWSKIFNKPTRELVAHEFAVTFFEEHGKGAVAENSAARNQSTQVDDATYLAYKSEFSKEFQHKGGPPGTSYWQDLAIANCLTWGIPAKTAADHFAHWWFSLRTVTSTSAQLLRYLEKQRGVPAGRTRG